MKRTVNSLLKEKGSDIWSVAPDTLVYDAITLMAEKGIGAVLVLRDERLVGIMSERDYLRQIILKDRSSRNTPVEAIMTEDVICVAPERTVDECMALMTEKKFRHLPVLRDGKVQGIISIGDVVRSLIAQKRDLIEQLENYIMGR